MTHATVSKQAVRLLNLYLGSAGSSTQFTVQKKIHPSWQFYSQSQQTQESGFIRIYWASSSFCAAERWSTHLGLPNGACLYIVTVLLLRDCQWTWAGCASWTSWSSWRIQVSRILWAERMAQAQRSALLPCASQAP